MEVDLPDCVNQLYKSQQEVCKHFADTNLAFTFDGKLLGDIGEALMAKTYDLQLCQQRTAGVDALAKNKTTVQIKATAVETAGPRYSPGAGTADHLLFVYIDFRAKKAFVRYNGPEAAIRELLPTEMRYTTSISLTNLVKINETVEEAQRLPVVW